KFIFLFSAHRRAIGISIATLSLALCASPALALADSAIPLGQPSVIPIGQTTQQLLTTVAALEAEENATGPGQTLACAVIFSSPTVRVGDHVYIAWGSVGALDPSTSSSSLALWPQHGSADLSFTQPAVWTYSYTFYSQSGATKTCV